MIETITDRVEVLEETLQDIGRETPPPHKDCVDWQVRYGPGTKLGEREFKLVEQESNHYGGFTVGSENVRRRLLAPVLESQAIGDALTGREYPLSPECVKLLRGMPVIDIGAHCGGTAVYWQEMLQPSELHCYEPNPTAFEYLKRNMAPPDYRHGTWTAYPAAVASSNGSTEYYEREVIYASGLYQNSYAAKTLQVELISGLDVLLRVQGEIGLLKIDAESSELAILYSARTQLDRVRAIYVEYHDEDGRRMIDALLRNFTVFHGRAMMGLEQGTVGYIRNEFFKQVRFA